MEDGILKAFKHALELVIALSFSFDPMMIHITLTIVGRSSRSI